MQHKNTIRVKMDYILTVLLFAFAIFLVVGVVIWSWPRDIISLQTTVDRDTYTSGDTITTTNTFEAFSDARSTYDNRIVCRNGTEQRAFLGTIVVTTTRRPPSQSTAQFVVPGNIYGDNCVIQNTASNCVDVLPFVEKCITEVSESNSFVIKE